MDSNPLVTILARVGPDEVFYPQIVLLAVELLGAVVIAGFVVWKIVRSVNYRGDPRHAKCPPDAP